MCCLLLERCSTQELLISSNMLDKEWQLLVDLLTWLEVLEAELRSTSSCLTQVLGSPGVEQVVGE